MKKTALLIASLAIVLPAEFYVWTKFVSPFFWSDGVAYTELAWGYLLFGLAFLCVPISIAGWIFEE